MMNRRALHIGVCGFALVAATHAIYGQNVSGTLTITLTVETSLALVIEEPAPHAAVPSTDPQPVIAFALSDRAPASVRLEAVKLARGHSEIAAMVAAVRTAPSKPPTPLASRSSQDAPKMRATSHGKPVVAVCGARSTS
jgi:hypothetical protein